MGLSGKEKRDWKLLREKLPGWQEAYMDKLNHEYIELLSGEGLPSDKFWALEKRIREDKKDTGVAAHMSASEMRFIIRDLLAEGAITMDDLEEFSEELKEQIARMMEAR